MSSVNPSPNPNPNPNDDGELLAPAAWSSKPLNGGVVEESATPVIDSGLWPPLGDFTKPESLPEVTGPAIANTETTTTSSTLNNVLPSGQKSIKRGGGGTSGAYVASNGIVTLRSPPSVEATQVVTAAVVDSNSKGQKETTRSNEQHYQRSSYRRGGNGAYHPRGNGGDNYSSNMQPHRGGGYRRGGYVRPSVHNAPPVIPQMHIPMRPFANNFIYPDAGSAMFYFPGPAQPMVPGPMFFPFVDPVLHGKILNQINYYFSNENLVKDLFLRRSMDEQGWVSVNLISGFKKVSAMTDDLQLILHVMRSSVLVEVQGDKIRRRNDWSRWLLPPVVQDSLVTQLHGIGLSSSRSSSSGDLQGRERAAVV